MNNVDMSFRNDESNEACINGKLKRKILNHWHYSSGFSMKYSAKFLDKKATNSTHMG